MNTSTMMMRQQRYNLGSKLAVFSGIRLDRLCKDPHDNLKPKLIYVNLLF